MRDVVGPDFPLTIDSNCGWTVREAKYCLRQLEACHLLLAEQPISADTIGPFYHKADLITAPLELGPPYASVPAGAGLGVELDESQLQRWRV